MDNTEDPKDPLAPPSSSESDSDTTLSPGEASQKEASPIGVSSDSSTKEEAKLQETKPELSSSDSTVDHEEAITLPDSFADEEIHFADEKASSLADNTVPQDNTDAQDKKDLISFDLKKADLKDIELKNTEEKGSTPKSIPLPPPPPPPIKSTTTSPQPYNSYNPLELNKPMPPQSSTFKTDSSSEKEAVSGKEQEVYSSEYSPPPPPPSYSSETGASPPPYYSSEGYPGANDPQDSGSPAPDYGVYEPYPPPQYPREEAYQEAYRETSQNYYPNGQAYPRPGAQGRVPRQRVVTKSEKRSFFGFPLVLLLLGLFAIGSCDFVMLGMSSSIAGKGETKLSKPGIGVLVIRGEIFNTDWAIRAVRRFEGDENIKALLIRIDTPGGAVAPCQELYTVLERFKKPKIVSMGSIAASGGYYIAVTGDTIFANPGTITGSIGVIMEAVEFSEAMEKIGVKSEVIKSGKYKDAGSPFRIMQQDEREIFQSMVMSVYEQFVGDVKKGRPLMTEEAVRALADGRIYSGEDARMLGLIDELGGFEEAMVYTLDKAGLPADEEPQIAYEDGQRTIWGQFFNGAFSFLDPVKSMTSPGISMKFIYLPGL
jgi:protease-4